VLSIEGGFLSKSSSLVDMLDAVVSLVGDAILTVLQKSAKCVKRGERSFSYVKSRRNEYWEIGHF